MPAGRPRAPSKGLGAWAPVVRCCLLVVGQFVGVDGVNLDVVPAQVLDDLI